MSTDVDDFLAHYGVKGMKWGVIRKSPSGSSNGPPSRREVRTTAAYIRKGYDPREAEKKAAGRIKVENILLASGGVALAAGAGYVAYRAGERHFGKVNLPMGAKVHHVNVHGPDLNIQDKPMFVSFDKRDQKFYDSVFANFARNRAKAENIYKSTLEATTDIRAPSNMEARRLYRDFAKQYGSTQSYADFNYSFNGEGQGSARLKKKFAEYMGEKGYNAMIDNFDSVKSARLRTTKPTILFDPTRSIKKVEDVLIDSGTLPAKALRYDLVGTAARAGSSPAAIGIGVLAGLGAFSNYRSEESGREQRVDAFKSKNPSTKLTDAEIYNREGLYIRPRK